ncbi:MAG TPA: polyprenyl synthetase family protein [Bacillota bacterium]|jgi:heptaprenyl diphosphate synthase|nr:polyprenyl synthetase family protein [Bacillota bacterium]HQJ36548.1 polyprenyl synthetase family protein [Bacillota bacterium]HQL35362.1 polyprenyl synthetase family protein [Bacillota bacterium]HRS20926.1 polyprenyl synthetase family protein [Clostridia bacterium]
MWSDNRFLKKEMDSVEDTIKNSLRTRNKTVKEALVRFVESGGKRLRPAFTILGGTFGQYDSNTIVPIAAALEIIHMATLIHDDIIDDARLRRGNETVHSVLGKDVAVYSGDFLLTRAFMLVADYADIDMLKQVAKASAYICDSEIAQNEQKFDTNVSVKQYLKRIGGKTAALFAISLYMGAYKAGCPKKLVNRLGVLGNNIGMAFQIVDDILDLTGNQAKVGKPLLSDAAQGIYTLPVLYALHSEYRDEAIKAINKTHEDKGEYLYEVLSDSKAIERSKNIAEKFIGKAMKIAGELPESIGRDIIVEIIDEQLERKF